VSPSPAFDFAYLWKRMNLKSSKVFSTKFLVQAGLITDSDSFRVACLDDLTQAWMDMVQGLDICGIDPSLEIVYRLQPATPKWKRKDKGKERAPEAIRLTQEDLDLARAIEASLSDQRRDPSQGIGLDTVSAGEIQEKISSQVKARSLERPQEGLMSPGSSKDDKTTSGQGINFPGSRLLTSTIRCQQCLER
jgi:exonuclease V